MSGDNVQATEKENKALRRKIELLTFTIARQQDCYTNQTSNFNNKKDKPDKFSIRELIGFILDINK